MTTTSEAKIYERLNVMAQDIGSIKTDLAVVAISCQDCRPIVMGNGNLPINMRIDRLEQARTGRSKWFWMVVVSVSSLAVSIMGGAVVGVVMHSLGN